MNSLTFDLLEAFIGDLAQDADLQAAWLFQLFFEELLEVGAVFRLVVFGESGFDFLEEHVSLSPCFRIIHNTAVGKMYCLSLDFAPLWKCGTSFFHKPIYKQGKFIRINQIIYFH